MKEVPKNPNVRQPYSDVSLELGRLIGDVVSLASAPQDKEDRKRYIDTLVKLDQIQLVVSAILDPDALTEQEWKSVLESRK